MHEELATLGRTFGLRAEVFHGGASYGPQESALAAGIDILVATPGRVIDHLQRGALDLGNVQHAVLDEADEMLNMGFAEDIESIFSYVNVSEREEVSGTKRSCTCSAEGRSKCFDYCFYVGKVLY